MQKIEYLPVKNLHPHPQNPRKELGDLEELAESIKAKGILQNLTVVPVIGSITQQETGEYIVIIGHRRLAAAKKAGLTEVPCAVARMDKKEQLATMLLENMQRTDLTAYEQAQGFQLMLDLGETVESISKQSGFAPTTIRRRLKLGELDQEILKDISKRQVSMGDLDRLGKIEDVKKRNEVLKTAGTANFDEKYKITLRKQKIQHNLLIIKDRLATAKLLKTEDTYGSKYESVGCQIDLEKWQDGQELVPAQLQGETVYYTIHKEWGYLRFYRKNKVVRNQKTPEEIQEEQTHKEAWTQAKAIKKIHYEMRREFAQSLMGKKCEEKKLLQGAIMSHMIRAMSYGGADREILAQLLGLEDYGIGRLQKTVERTKKMDESKWPLAIYACFDDNAGNGYTSSYEGQMPQHDANHALTALYQWLTDMGYVMSDAERAMQDGSHEIFREATP